MLELGRPKGKAAAHRVNSFRGGRGHRPELVDGHLTPSIPEGLGPGDPIRHANLHQGLRWVCITALGW